MADTKGSGTRKAVDSFARSERKGKPSVTKRAAGRALTGAGTGAAIGSAVPLVGTAAGAVAGGALGGLSGASQAAREKRAQAGPARRTLVAEFLLCIVILALSPLSKPEGETNPGDWMRRGSAMCALFIALGMVSSIGPRAARAAVALGALVTVALVIDQREIFSMVAAKFSGADGKIAGRVSKTSPPDTDEPLGGFIPRGLG